MDKQRVVQALRWAEYHAMVKRMHGSEDDAKREELFRTLAQRIEEGEETTSWAGRQTDKPKLLLIDWSDFDA